MTHSNQPRLLSLPNQAPVMVRDFTAKPVKWTPATVANRSGPISYKCKLEEGGSIVRRHLDQNIPRSDVIDGNPVLSRSTEPLVFPSDQRLGPSLPTAKPVETDPPLRRSQRPSKPVDRLGY